MKRASIAAGIFAVAVLLAACSSSSETEGSTAAAGATSSSSGSSSSPSVAASRVTSPSAPGSSAITVGGDTTELDAQTATWFDTFCTGMGPLGELQNGASSISSVQQL